MRTLRPFDEDKATVRVLLLISQRIGRSCPTRNELMDVTGLPKRKVWVFMDALHKRGVIEIEEKAIRPGNWRRLRIAGGKWTDWTTRRVKRRRFPLEPSNGQKEQ
ncbi:MAG TPA: hypothetical protein VGM96_31230 [Reyranella sp.]|jgi:hypothetical protein